VNIELKIIFEDKHIIVVEKPPKVPSQSDKSYDMDLMTQVGEYIKQTYNRPKPYVGLLHRLDRPVGGLMVFAKTKEANKFISEEIRNMRFNKAYFAVICGKPEKEKGELRNHLKKFAKNNVSKVVDSSMSGSKEAILEYEVIDSIDTDNDGVLSLIKIKLITGRHHQIRIQLSHAGFPLWGDTKYNEAFAKRKGWTQIALWSHHLDFKHPFEKKRCSFDLFPMDEYPFNLFSSFIQAD